MKINIAVKQDGNGEMQIARVPIPEMLAKLKAMIEEMGLLDNRKDTNSQALRIASAKE